MSGCLIVWGDICVIESLVGSLLASAILTAIATGVAWLSSYGMRKQAKERYLAARPRHLRAAKLALLDSDYELAMKALEPLLLRGDNEGQRLMDVVRQRHDDYLRAATLVRDGKVGEAMPTLLALARNGDTDALCLAGLLLVKGKSYLEPQEQGTAWLAVAAARGSKRAREELSQWLEAITPLEEEILRAYLDDWKGEYRARKREIIEDAAPSDSW